MTVIALITQQVPARTSGTFGFSAGRWIGLFMLNTLSWYFLLSRVLESRSGRNKGTKIRVAMDFQIDLGISLLDYGICLDWDGVLGKRSSYMQTGAFKPGECKKCFFCLNDYTHGITYCQQKQPKVTVEYACGTRVKRTKRTHDPVSLGIRSGDYC